MPADLIFGVDISRSQGDVDFHALASAPTDPAQPRFRYAILKATEGGDFLDPNFKTNWAKLRELDPATDADPWLIRGAYHFARPDNRLNLTGQQAGETEARWFCEVIKAEAGHERGCLPLFVDWETRAGTSERNRAWLTAFVHVLVAELGRAPGIYTGPGVWRETTDNWTELLSTLTLWQVQYQRDGWDPAVAFPERRLIQGEDPPQPWQLWQWSGGGQFNYYKPKYGKVPGVPSGVVDVNRFDGSLAALRELALLDGHTAEPPTIPDHVPAPIGARLGAGVLAHVDLTRFDPEHPARLVAVVQGLLLAAGHGPAGLVGTNGRPDGKAGPRTLAELQLYKREAGLPRDTRMDAHTWFSLLHA